MRQSITAAANLDAGSKTSEGQSIQALAWRHLLNKTTAVIGLVIIVILVLTALLADVIAPYSPTAMFEDDTMSAPTLRHPMGTDLLGRDTFSRVVHGSRVSLYVGVLSPLLALALGVPLGIQASYVYPAG